MGTDETVVPRRLDTAIPEQIGVAVRNIGIPPCPAILLQVHKEAEKDEPDFNRLTDLVSQDVGLSASLIKVTNSPALGLSRKVRSVKEAIHILGLRMTMQTIAGISLQKLFGHAPTLERFWDSTARRARVSRWLAQQRRIEGVSPDDAYTFGLFRDCGIPLLMIPFPQYLDLLKAANADETRAFTDIEMDGIGIHHAQVGAELAEEWYLPAELECAIRYHHDPAFIEGRIGEGMSVARYLVALGQLAEYLIQRATGLARNREWEKLGRVCLALLGMSDADLEQLGSDAIEIVAPGIA